MIKVDKNEIEEIFTTDLSKMSGKEVVEWAKGSDAKLVAAYIDKKAEIWDKGEYESGSELDVCYCTLRQMICDKDLLKELRI